MPGLQDIFRAVYGAWRLAHLDIRGMDHFDLSLTGFWRSFTAALIVAPLHLVLIFLSRDFPDGDAAWHLVVQGAAYASAWVVFPVVMVAVTRLLQVGERFIPFVVAYNWSTVIVMAVVVPTQLLADWSLDAGSSDMPAALVAFMVMAAMAAILFYQWFVARTALGVNAIQATAVVVLDLVVTMLLENAARAAL